jgi:hypothetical protein
MKATSLHFTSLALLSMLSCSVASAAAVTFDGNGSNAIQDYELAANWDPEAVAGSGDDVTVTGRFRLLDPAADYTINSLTVNGGGSVVAGGKLTVTSDVVINTDMTVKNNGSVFTWGTGTGGGLMTLGDGATGTDTLELVYGTHDTKAVGDDLTVAANGRILFNWFNAQTESSTIADIGLSGDLTFTSGSSVKVDLNGGAVGALTEGSYFLVSSDNISGDLPTLLTNANWDATQAANSFLSFENGINEGLYLNVIPEPGTYALLAGCFALASVMIRRRR